MKNKFREIVESLTDPVLSITTGLYTEEYKVMLPKASTIEEYISLLGKEHDNLNAPSLLKDLRDRKINNREVYDEIVSIFNEQKNVRSTMSAKEKVSLTNYLHKKLTVSMKEAQLIGSVIKDYVKKKSSIKEYSSFYIPLLDFMKTKKEEVKESSDLDSFMSEVDEENPNMNILFMYTSLKNKTKTEFGMLQKEYDKMKSVKESILRKGKVREASHDENEDDYEMETSLSRSLLPSKYSKHPYTYDSNLDYMDDMDDMEDEKKAKKDFYDRHPILKKKKKK